MTLTIGIVVPCYNEATRLPADAFVAYADTHPEVTFRFVDDGSTDGTFDMLSRLRDRMDNRISVARLEQNSGKAEAVRRGVMGLLGDSVVDVVGYIDADLATPLDQLDLLVAALTAAPSAQVAFGSRVKLLGRAIERYPSRHYIGRVFATVASMMLGLAVYDTQCGAKLFRRGVAERVFADPFVGRWVFDVEIFARLVALLGVPAAERQLIEVPLTRWTDVGQSKIRSVDMIRVPLDLARIAARYPRRS